MERVVEFIKEMVNLKPETKKIHVYGWQKEYDHILIPSVAKYLFEDFDVIENLAPLTNENREGIKKEKFYVTVHDTGDSTHCLASPSVSNCVIKHTSFVNFVTEHMCHRCNFIFV